MFLFNCCCMLKMAFQKKYQNLVDLKTSTDIWIDTDFVTKWIDHKNNS